MKKQKKILNQIPIIWIIISAITPEYKKFYDDSYESCVVGRNAPYFLIMALKTGDESYCNKLENPEGCRARLTKDASYCDDPEMPEDEKNQCLAFILKDSALCPPESYYCLAYTSSDASYCDQLEEEEITDCKADVALNADHYLNPQIDQECRDQAYTFAATAVRDASICEKIVNLQAKQECISLIT